MYLLYILIEATVKIITYSTFCISLWLLVSRFLTDYIKSGYRGYKKSRQIKRLNELNNTQKIVENQNVIIKHLELLLSSLSKKQNPLAVLNFILLSSIIFITTTLTLFFMLKEPLFSITVAAILASIPYIYIRFKLTSMRLSTSVAFMQEYHLFLQNYQSTGKDVYYTMRNVNADIKDKNLKMFCSKLLSSMQKDRGEEDFKRAINVFTYSINSTTSKRFGKLFELAFIENADISKSLLDLNEDIKKRKQDITKDKTQKLETILMGYASLFLFPVFIFMTSKVTGVVDYWYVFKQKAPLTLFIIVSVLSIISAFSAYLLSKPRADL
jgi:hypothetical protein